MGKKMPLLKPREVIANIEALDFKHKRTDGSHAQYERPADATHLRAVVTVDVAMSQFSKRLMKSMIRQSGFSQDEFCTGVAKGKTGPVLAPKQVPEGSKNA